MDADPRHAQALNNLAIVLASEGQLDQARELLQQAVESDPVYAEGYFNLGIVLDQSRQPRQARTDKGRRGRWGEQACWSWHAPLEERRSCQRGLCCDYREL